MWNNKSLQTLFFFATRPNGMQVQMQRPNLFNTFGSVHNNTLSWVFERRGFATLTDKERAQREKEKEREKREKEQKKARALKEREQERAQREKEKEKNLRERERQKNKEAELKAKEKAKAAREKAQALKAKEKERETLQKQKEKDRREKEKLQAEKDKEQEKKRRAKDLKAMQPKRSKSAYVFYVTEQMPALRQKTGEPVAAVMKQLAAKWPTLTESEKKVYEDMAAKDKERHLSEKESFAKTQPPKKPLTAYILFYNDIRETIVKENPGIAVTEMSKIVGQKWNEISKGEKDKYTKKAQEAAEKYAAELALFEKQ